MSSFQAWEATSKNTDSVKQTYNQVVFSIFTSMEQFVKK